MGAYTDILANAKSWDAGGADGISVAIDRVITKQVERFLKRQGDIAYPSGYTEVDEVQSLAAFNCTVTGGNFTLAFTLQDGTTFTTANIAHDANAATIETAIDTAATGNVTGWTNGDITLALTGDLNANAATLTYDGNSVDASNHDVAVIADVNLSGGSTGTVSTTNEGAAPVDEVQSIGTYNGSVTGGNFTLTVNLAEESAFTTANIVHNANAATIETAIDTVATGNVTGWTNGDITISGGDLTTNAVVLTYDGNSVDETNHATVIITDVDLSGGGTVGDVTTTNEGVTPVDEVQSMAIYAVAVTGGNFTLTFNLADATTFTTANIAHDANAATIETAIDVAATAEPVPAWVNGDISVSGGPLTTNAVVLTFDGDSVDEANHVTTVVNDVSLSGGTTGTLSITTNGQTVRLALAILNVMGIINGVPPQGTTSGMTAASTRASNPWLPSQETLQALAMQAAIDDNTDGMYPVLMAAMGLSHLL